MKTLTHRFLSTLAFYSLMGLVFGAPTVQQAQAASKGTTGISIMAANSIGSGQPYALFSGQKWKASPDAKYVKLHMYFNKPIKVKDFIVEHCGGNPGSITAFVNFDEKTFYLSRGKSKVKNTVNYKAKKPLKVRSLTLNFGYEKKVCVKKITLKDENDQEHKFFTPKIINGTAKASSTLSEKSYSVMNLFDSRFEYAWASKGKPTGVSLNFKFPSSRKVTALRIWNGYQRSDTHCKENSRVKEMVITGDGGYKVTVKVKDEMGGQTVVLPKPYEGKNLRLKVTKAYLGSTYKDLVVSELRFVYDEKKFKIGSFGFVKEPKEFMLDSTNHLKALSKSNNNAFKKAGFDSLLTSSIGAINGMKSTGTGTFESIFRFRKDGSLFIEVKNKIENNINKKTFEHRYFVLGNYVVTSSSKGKLGLRVFGLYRKTSVTEFSYDCNSCGRDCNQKRDLTKGIIFQDYLEITQTDRKTIKDQTRSFHTPKKNGYYVIKTVTSQKKRKRKPTLQFGTAYEGAFFYQ